MIIIDSVPWKSPHWTATSSRFHWLTGCDENIFQTKLHLLFFKDIVQILPLYETFHESFLAHYCKEIIYTWCENIFSFESKKLKATTEALNVYCCTLFSPSPVRPGHQIQVLVLISSALNC